MGIGSGAAIALGLGGAAAGIGGAAISASAAGHAADTQSAAADQAAQLQYQESQNALNAQLGIYGNQQQELSPLLNTGYGALANLGYLAGITPMSANAGSATASVPADGNGWGSFPSSFTSGFNPLGYLANGNTSAVPNPAASGINIPKDLGSLVNPSLGAPGSLLQPFQAPTDVTQQNDPGYKFRLQLGQDAIDRAAAANGTSLTGGALKDAIDYNQNFASNEYGNVYNRAFNTFESNQANTWNRLAALAGIGQTAVNTSANAGSNAASGITNIDLSTGANIGNQLNNAAAARASGYVGGANAWSNALSGGTGNLLNLYLLSQLNSGGTLPPIQTGG